MPGHFITFEGAEGVGKSSLSRALSAWLGDQDCAVRMTREPGGTPLADEIRGIFLNPPDADVPSPMAELFLVSAARAQHVCKVIAPAKQDGAWVLCDRFADSTRVYQGALGGLDRGVIDAMIRGAVGEYDPDLTFLLDCPVEVAVERLAARRMSVDEVSNRFDMAESELHERMRSAFLDLSKEFSDRYVVLDATKSPGDLLEDCVQAIRSKRWL